MTDEPGPASPVPGQEQPGQRLDSWKDIAAYLKRDVSTVQRWEKRERMPVHRHVHDKLGSVYAFRPELDAWWRGRGGQLPGQEPNAPVQGEQAASRPWPPIWFRAALAGVVVLGIAASVGLLRRFASPDDRTGASVTTAAPSTAATTRHVNPEAEDLLQRARYLSVRTTNEDNKRVIELLEQAIALDPAFASAYGELASAYVTRLAYVTPDESRELEQKAFSMAHKALSIDANAPEGYIGRGDLLWTRSHRFAHESAIQQFRQALSLNPRSDETHRRLARVFVHIGFFKEAIHHASTALTINPSNAQALNSRAQALLWTGNDKEALAILSSVPGPVLPELVDANVVFALFRLNRREDAWSHLARAKRKHAADLDGTLTGAESLLLADSDPVAAQRLIDGLRKRKATNPSHHAAYFAAAASARMRRAAQAVEWLREASETGFPCYPLFERDSNLDPIRKDPQFQRFMAEMAERSASLRKALLSS